MIEYMAHLCEALFNPQNHKHDQKWGFYLVCFNATYDSAQGLSLVVLGIKPSFDA